jgi:hypothetical protein
MKTLTNVDINIRIAEHCGWSHIVYDKYMGAFGESPSHEDDDVPIPDYCNNLNAMHEAEATLTDQQYDEYVALICHESKIYGTTGRWVADDRRIKHSAPAQLRAELFVKTIDRKYL